MIRKLLVIPLTMILLSGCSGGLISDSDRAGPALRAALDVWKQGKPSSALSELRPVIYMNEANWESGLKLVDYKMDETSGEFGRKVSWSVDLTLMDVRGTTQAQRAVYLIGKNG